MTYDFVACQSFAGGFDMGMTQAGFRMVHKVEQKGAFGMANCEANRELLGDQWTTQAGSFEEWEPHDVPVVVGNPPCSGFSPLSNNKFRGSDSPVNSCMWVFVDYVARIRPQIAIFESVQQAYTGGLDLMRALHSTLEQLTGEQWQLTHLLHNNASVGGCSIRKRYFWVVSRIPFGIEEPHVDRVPNLMDAIGDLQGMAPTWERQPYRQPPSWWSKNKRSDTGATDGHAGRMTPAMRRAHDLMKEVEWNQRENLSMVARRYYQKMGTLPDSWGNLNTEKLIRTDFKMGYNQITRWKPEGMARVITGAALDVALHPYEDRTFTHREVARIQGFPDDWRVRPLKGSSGLHMTWGKGIPVDCGKWVGEWIAAALDGNPGSMSGEPRDDAVDRELVINVTNSYRMATDER